MDINYCLSCSLYMYQQSAERTQVLRSIRM